jgi:toxin ParE1/3/4
MAQVVKLPRARKDLSDIFQYIADTDFEQAVKFLKLIDEKCQLLAKFPEMGRARHELLINLRSFPFKTYIIFYQPIENGIEIFRVLHGSRDIEGVFDNLVEDAGSIN